MINEDTSLELAIQTVCGAALLALSEKEKSLQILRENVTSPGGTTQAALDVLMDGRFEEILKETSKAAAQRSKELSS